MRTLATTILAVLLPALSLAASSSSTTLSPTAQHILVSKQIGAEQWVVVQDLATGFLLGNVSAPGAPARFLWCETLAASGSELRFLCSGAADCESPDCTRTWHLLPQVSVPISFFHVGTFDQTFEAFLGPWEGLGPGVRFDEIVRRPDGKRASVAHSADGDIVAAEAGDGDASYRYQIDAPHCRRFLVDQVTPDLLIGVALSATPDASSSTCPEETYRFVAMSLIRRQSAD